MRTTIDLDEELLRTAKALAASRQQTLSVVISELAWKGLRPDAPENPRPGRMRNGFPLLSVMPGSQPVTPEHVNELLERADLDETDR